MAVPVASNEEGETLAAIEGELRPGCGIFLILFEI